MNPLNRIVIFNLFLFSTCLGQIEAGDYDLTGKFGFSLINFEKPGLSLETGAILFKNRNSKSKITTIYSLTGFVLQKEKNAPSLYGLKIGAEHVSNKFYLGYINAIKEEFMYLDDELYFVPQVGLSALFLINIYIGYSIRLKTNGREKTPANINFSFYFNMINIM